MKYQQYDEYKQVTLGWLDSLPSHWQVKKLKYLGDSIIGLTYSPDDVVQFEDKGTLVLRSSNVQNKKLAFDDNVYVKKEIPEKLRTQLGDILICARNGSRALIGKNAEIDESAVGLTFGAFMMIFRSEHNRYLSYVFNSAIFEYQSGTFLTATINQLTSSNLNSFEVPLPPKAEQAKIANFLDHETAQIDSLIDKQQTLIQLLKEKRQAVISHAVTKGLNPNAPMKDSGVEWLGEVPEHWNIVKLSYRMKLLSGDGITSQDIEPTGQYPVYGGNGLRGYTDRYNCEGHHVLIGRQGALCGNINLAQGKFFATEHAVVVYPYQDFNISFLSEFLRFMDLGQYSVSAAQPGISVERINGLKILVPPYYEQTEIGEHVENIIKRFEDLSTKANQQIKLLQERRTALISAAVTGKIDVRGWQSPE